MALASIEFIKVDPHPNADTLELAQVRGWQCVVKRGEFKTGEKVVYIEVDTWVPHAIAPFLSGDDAPRMYEGILGQRLRTIQLRGEISQGLVLPLSVLDVTQWGIDFYEGQDVTEVLGVVKWHAPVPTSLSGEVWPWPDGIPKTDQENIQNIYDAMVALSPGEWVMEEKLNGSSCTIYRKTDGSVGICTRNWELKLNEANQNNAFILAMNRQRRWFDVFARIPQRIALQAELCGPGIQGNPYHLTEPRLYLFDIYWIEKQRYATPFERSEFIDQIDQWASLHIHKTPMIGIVDQLQSLDELLAMAEGRSLVHTKGYREGLVFKTWDLHDGKMYSFKVVSNGYLLSAK